MTVPTRPKIYHIVHVDNLASIVSEGCLWSDAAMTGRTGVTVIGMNHIKQRRRILAVDPHPGLHVGDCVPFYFCSRSIMLFKINKANDDELTYKGGQSMIVHLEADLCAAVEWAEACGQRWAFSLANAATRYTAFRSKLDQLDEINWVAVAAKYWSAPDLKEGKQAEFLVERSFPWGLVERIGIHARAVAPRVAAAVAGGAHRPRVEIQPAWYY